MPLPHSPVICMDGIKHLLKSSLEFNRVPPGVLLAISTASLICLDKADLAGFKTCIETTLCGASRSWGRSSGCDVSTWALMWSLVSAACSSQRSNIVLELSPMYLVVVSCCLQGMHTSSYTTFLILQVPGFPQLVMQVE